MEIGAAFATPIPALVIVEPSTAANSQRYMFAPGS
jgi:hypothetical protein